MVGVDDRGGEMDERFDDFRITAMGMLIEAYTGLTTVLERELAAAGLALSWFEVLVRLGRTPGHALRMSELAAQVSFSASGLTRLVDRMESAGLVRRQACPEDRRGSLAVLTDEGAARLHEVLPHHLAGLQSHLVDPLGPDQLDALTSACRRIRDALRATST